MTTIWQTPVKDMWLHQTLVLVVKLVRQSQGKLYLYTFSSGIQVTAQFNPENVPSLLQYTSQCKPPPRGKMGHEL